MLGRIKGGKRGWGPFRLQAPRKRRQGGQSPYHYRGNAVNLGFAPCLSGPTCQKWFPCSIINAVKLQIYCYEQKESDPGKSGVEAKCCRCFCAHHIAPKSCIVTFLLGPTHLTTTTHAPAGMGVKEKGGLKKQRILRGLLQKLWAERNKKQVAVQAVSRPEPGPTWWLITTH
jgi:hypothetical protein